jgi:hypothetical protein
MNYGRTDMNWQAEIISSVVTSFLVMVIVGVIVVLDGTLKIGMVLITVGLLGMVMFIMWMINKIVGTP